MSICSLDSLVHSQIMKFSVARKKNVVPMQVEMEFAVSHNEVFSNAFIPQLENTSCRCPYVHPFKF